MPVVLKVMAPVLVPDPLVVDTPAVGVIAHVVVVAGVPPLAMAYVPLFPAGKLVGPDKVQALGVVQGIKLATVTVLVHVVEAGGVHPEGLVAFTLVNETVYVPAVENVMAPVLVPVPLTVDTPVVGDMDHEVALAGVPPLAKA